MHELMHHFSPNHRIPTWAKPHASNVGFLHAYRRVWWFADLRLATSRCQPIATHDGFDLADSTNQTELMNAPYQISAVIFDMDGTLHDTEIVFHNAIKAGVTAVGFSVSDAFCHSLLGIPGVDGDAMLREHLGPSFPYSEYTGHYRMQVNRVLASAIPLKPGAIEIVKSLTGRGVKVAVATSADRSRAEHQLRLSGLHAHIPIIVTRDDVDRAKPHPDLFLRAAALLNMPVGQCLAVEDSFNGVRSAYAAGTMPVMVPDLVRPTDEIRTLCVYVASSLHDLEEWLVGRSHQLPSARAES